MTVTREHLRAARHELLRRRRPGSVRPGPAVPPQPLRPERPVEDRALGAGGSSSREATGVAIRGKPRDAGIAAVWIVFLATLLYLEPAPADQAPAIPLWGELLGVSFFAAFGAALTGLLGSKEWGLKASVAAGALGLGVTVACVATDHHTPGLSWGYELAGFCALSAVSLRRLIER